MLAFIKAEKAWIVSHLVWIVAVVVALGVGNIALQQYKQTLAVNAQLTVSEANVKSLQQQIATTDAQAAQKVQTIVKIVHDAPPTPAGVVAAVPQLTDAPLNARVIPNDPVDVSVAAVPFLQFVAQAATDKVNLTACTSDLGNEKAIVTQKDVQIADLKKKPKFLKRVENAGKLIGVGVGIGIFLALHL